MRGRKKKEITRDKIYAVRITTIEKEMLNKNPKIKKEIDTEIRRLLEMYTTPFLKDI